MKRSLGFAILLAIVASVAWLIQRGAEERTVRRVLADVQTAALPGLNSHDPKALDSFFATEAEGAQAAGLAETQQPYKDFVEQMSYDSLIQVHSFDIQALEVHEEAGLAKVTYRLHFSVVRNGQAIFSAKATQNIALLQTPRGWRIMGGDAAQLEDVTGNWPPR